MKDLELLNYVYLPTYKSEDMSFFGCMQSPVFIGYSHRDRSSANKRTPYIETSSSKTTDGPHAPMCFLICLDASFQCLISILIVNVGRHTQLHYPST